MFWRIRTALMFVYLTALLMALGWVLMWAMDSFSVFFLAGLCAIALMICFATYFWSKKLALAANRAKIVTEDQEPRLYALVRDVAMRADLPMPEVGVVESMQMNAFATGRNPKNSAVVVTRGLLRSMPEDEIRGVLAHEMSHVRNRDILVMSVASAISILLTYVSRFVFYATMFSDRRNSGAVLIALVASITVPFAALMIQMSISRKREYLADASGAEIINDPRALARALTRLKGDTPSYTTRSTSSNPAEDYATAHMWISSHLGRGIGSIFSTHPPLEDRIDRLNKMADSMGL